MARVVSCFAAERNCSTRLPDVNSERVEPTGVVLGDLSTKSLYRTSVFPVADDLVFRVFPRRVFMLPSIRKARREMQMSATVRASTGAHYLR